jgi:hypothetical protein
MSTPAPFQQTDISEFPELAVKQAADAIEPLEVSKDICCNPECPNGGEIKMQAFKGTGFCSINCQKANGIDHVNYGKSEMMLVTRDEASQIRAGREDIVGFRDGSPIRRG